MTSFHTQRKNESREYPGVYQPPSYNWTKVMQHLKEAPSMRSKPAVAICESPRFYCIELKVPGFSKEDFIVTIEAGKLHIYGLSAACNAGEQSGHQLQDTGYDCFEHSLELPKYIDSDFVRAEYNAGVLRFVFPKIDYEHTCTVSRIIVY